jgi:hypothetical protein
MTILFKLSGRADGCARSCGVMKTWRRMREIASTVATAVPIRGREIAGENLGKF